MATRARRAALLAMAAMSAIGCSANRKPDAELVITDVTLLAAPGEPVVNGATQA